LGNLEDSQIRWLGVLFVAVVQNGIAISAVYSSREDRLSDVACIGGHFGSVANMAILVVVVIWAAILAVRSFRDPTWHYGLGPLSAVAFSSVLAILIGMDAALRCSV
jgi:hypothetical protein